MSILWTIDLIFVFQMPNFAKNERRVIIHFLHKEGITPAEAANCLHRHYGDSAPDRSTASRWMARFAAGREVLEDDPRVGGPVTATMEDNVVRVHTLLRTSILLLTKWRHPRASLLGYWRRLSIVISS